MVLKESEMNNLLFNMKISTERATKRKYIAVSVIVVTARGKVIEKYSEVVSNISIDSRTNFHLLRTGVSVDNVYAHIIKMKEKHKCSSINVWGNDTKILWKKLLSLGKHSAKVIDFPKTFNNLKVESAKLQPEIKGKTLSNVCHSYGITSKRGLNSYDIAYYSYKLHRHLLLQNIISSAA